MTASLSRFRSLLVHHANSLPKEEAKAWLTNHRLMTLHTEPALCAELREFLNRQRRQITGRNLLVIRFFQNVMDALTPHDAPPIPVLPLKGIALLDTLYRADIGLRTMGDVDLLVPEHDIDAAINRLERIGFREGMVSHRLRHVMHHRVLTREPDPGSNTGSHSVPPVVVPGVLELHSRLGYAYGRGSTWKNLSRSHSTANATVHDRPAYLLTPPAEFMYLLTHCYKHVPFTLLGWVHEILELSDRLPSQPLPEIVATARRQRCRHVLAAVTTIFRRALGDDALPQISIPALDVDPTRIAIHDALFLRSETPHINPLSPPQKRSMWIEELRAYLLADTANDVALDFIRMAQIHYHARWPTRIRPGDQ
jgi:Uncharacterised nucleotidyltransferase